MSVEVRETQGYGDLALGMKHIKFYSDHQSGLHLAKGGCREQSFSKWHIFQAFDARCNVTVKDLHLLLIAPSWTLRRLLQTYLVCSDRTHPPQQVVPISKKESVTSVREGIPSTHAISSDLDDCWQCLHEERLPLPNIVRALPSILLVSSN